MSRQNQDDLMKEIEDYSEPAKYTVRIKNGVYKGLIAEAKKYCYEGSTGYRVFIKDIKENLWYAKRELEFLPPEEPSCPPLWPFIRELLLGALLAILLVGIIILGFLI